MCEMKVKRIIPRNLTRKADIPQGNMCSHQDDRQAVGSRRNAVITGQVEMEIAVRMESQCPFDLSLIDIDVFGKCLKMRRQRSGQTCLARTRGGAM